MARSPIVAAVANANEDLACWNAAIDAMKASRTLCAAIQ